MAAEQFQYWEIWNKLEADGGTRQGFLGWAIRCRRRRRLNGEDALSATFLKTHPRAAAIKQGAVLRPVLSNDGTLVQEWPIEKVRRGTGNDVLMDIECIPFLATLVNYPITQTDGDGFVYANAPLIQVTPANAVSSRILSNTPAYVGVGTVTPTALGEWPFNTESARAGLRRMEELLRSYEVSARRNGGAQWLIDITTLGGSAPTLSLRSERNLKTFVKESLGGQVTRVGQIHGADGDDGPATIAWAYWEVEATSGAGPFRVKYKAVHGGPGPIAFDDQLNHANLPGGANSLYVELRDGTFRNITDSFASTQEVEVASLATIAVGDWHRFVASSTGKHLSSLDSPADLATSGIRGGEVETAFDDFTCIVKNSMTEVYTNPAALPDGWTGLTAAKTTAAGEFLSCGQGISINTTAGDGNQIAAPPARTWYVRARRTTYCAGAWIRLRALMSTGSMTLRVKVGSTVVGKGHVYASPSNQWVQLKIEGLDLSPYVGTSVAITVELVKSEGTSTVNMVIDSMWVGPAIGFRAPTIGSNPARAWQEVNSFLVDRGPERFVARGTIVDLARMGGSAAVEVVLGQAVVVSDADVPYTGRLSEIVDDPQDPSDADLTLSDLPPRLSRQQSKPLELTIPFFEAIHKRVADRDDRNAALNLKAEITASDAGSVTITLTAADTLGGVPVASYAAFRATYSSGTGLGPYVFLKPASGAGMGRVVFTLKLPGRADVVDAVDVDEVSAADSIFVRAERIAATANTVTYRVRVRTSAGVTLNLGYTLSGCTLTGGPSNPTTIITTNDFATTGFADYVVNRPNAGAGDGGILWTATYAGLVDGSAAMPISPRMSYIPSYSVSQSAETDTTADVTVAINYDPEARVTGVEFATQTGQAAMSSFVLDSVAPFTKQVTLIEGQVSKVFFRIKGAFGDGSSGVVVEDFVTVRPSAKPLPPIVTLSMDTSGNVIARIEGDDLTASLRWASSKSAMPADATVDGATAQNSRQHTTGTLQTLALTEICYMKVVAHSAVSGGGTKSVYVEARLTRDSASIDKWLVVPGSAFGPLNDGSQWSRNHAFGPGTSTGQQFGYAPVSLPAGAVIKEVHLHGWRKTGSTTLEVLLLKIYGSAILDAATTVATCTISGSDSSTYQDVSVTGLSETLDANGNQRWLLQAELNAGASGGVAVGQVKIKYTSPNYGVTM